MSEILDYQPYPQTCFSSSFLSQIVISVQCHTHLDLKWSWCFNIGKYFYSTLPCISGNVALGKTAQQSSTNSGGGYTGYATLAVDGIWSYLTEAPTYCSHSDALITPNNVSWWFVTLDTTRYYAVTAITLVNRPGASSKLLRACSFICQAHAACRHFLANALSECPLTCVLSVLNFRPKSSALTLHASGAEFTSQCRLILTQSCLQAVMALLVLLKVCLWYSTKTFLQLCAYDLECNDMWSSPKSHYFRKVFMMLVSSSFCFQ